ncbi:MAG: hypothetical protein QG604_518 [Candidatus Dependentiae bacterium]|nr:hypothetical protein [Candidatus Dependentiae bacterium]
MARYYDCGPFSLWRFTALNTFWYISIAALVCALFTLLIAYRVWYHAAAAQQVQRNNRAITPAITTTWPITITVGILTPLPNEAAHYLAEGLSELLSVSSRTRYIIAPLPGDNTRVTLFEQAQHAGSTCDILVTFGVTCANIAAEAAEFLQHIPVIKAGLRNEQITRLLPHEFNTIILTTEYDYQQQVALFQKIKPLAKEVCILYRLHNEHIREEVLALSNALQEAHLKTHAHVLAHNTHIDNQLSAFSTSYDTLFLMPHTVTATNVQELVTYCTTKKITLCAQELDVVTLGAALGFGKSEKELGAHIGHLIRNLCEGKKKYPTGTIMTHYPNYHCVINKKKCYAQGIELSPEYITMLEQVHIVNHQRTPYPQYRHDQSPPAANRNV